MGELQGWALLALVGVAGYVVYKLFGFGKSAATAATAAAQAAGSTVADWTEAILPHAANLVQLAPNSTIVLPDGTELTSDLVHGAGAFTGTNNRTQIQFEFGGNTYRVDAQPDDTNTYYAAPMSAGNAPPPATSTSWLDWFRTMPGGA